MPLEPIAYVPSKSKPGELHPIFRHPDGHLSCNCERYAFSKRKQKWCGHLDEYVGEHPEEAQIMTTENCDTTPEANPTEMWAQLAAPFPAADIDWRAGATNQDKTKTLALAYLTARTVMDRLDAVCGPDGWRDEYVPGPAGGVLCRLSIMTPVGHWVTKEDVADNTDVEGVKGGVSDALKRAAVKWGVGRYLYGLDAQWTDCEQRGKSVVIKGRPSLPDWALPESERRGQQRRSRAPANAAAEPEPEEPGWRAYVRDGLGSLAPHLNMSRRAIDSYFDGKVEADWPVQLETLLKMAADNHAAKEEKAGSGTVRKS